MYTCIRVDHYQSFLCLCFSAAPSGTCQSPEQTSSGMEGWWGGLSSSLRTLHQCQTEDFPAGLHWLKYRDGFNNTFPDEVRGIKFYLNFQICSVIGET